MLDDLKYIHQKDSQDALGVAAKQWQQLLFTYELELPRMELQNVVLSGMGGSALPGVFMSSWPKQLQVPFVVNRDYDIPSFVSSETLFIAASYSGNTEETLSSLEKAAARGAQIVVVASGGKLAEIAKSKNYPLLLIPGGVQPRMCTLYFIKALTTILVQAGLCPASCLQELESAGSWLQSQFAEYEPQIPTHKNPAKKLAQELMGKSVVYYSGPKLFPAANRFKIATNENAKNVAWVNQYPELNHNEFIGWSSHPVDKPYAVVEIHSQLEHPRIAQRMELSARLLSGKRPHPETVHAVGDTILQQILWLSVFADFTTLYLALLNGADPTPVDLVETFKKELS